MVSTVRRGEVQPVGDFRVGAALCGQSGDAALAVGEGAGTGSGGDVTGAALAQGVLGECAPPHGAQAFRARRLEVAQADA